MVSVKDLLFDLVMGTKGIDKYWRIKRRYVKPNELCTLLLRSSQEHAHSKIVYIILVSATHTNLFEYLQVLASLLQFQDFQVCCNFT